MRIPIISSFTDRLLGTSKPQLNEFDVPAPAPMPDLSSLSPQNFGEPFYRYQERIQEVDSKKMTIDTIMNARLSVRAKTALVHLIETYYDHNVLLADLTGKKAKGGSSSNEQVEIAIYRLYIDVITVLTSAYKSDRNNPIYNIIISNFMNQMRYRLSRAKGQDRESIISRRVHIDYNARQKVTREGGQS